MDGVVVKNFQLYFEKQKKGRKYSQKKTAATIEMNSSKNKNQNIKEHTKIAVNKKYNQQQQQNLVLKTYRRTKKKSVKVK